MNSNKIQQFALYKAVNTDYAKRLGFFVASVSYARAIEQKANAQWANNPHWEKLKKLGKHCRPTKDKYRVFTDQDKLVISCWQKERKNKLDRQRWRSLYGKGARRTKQEFFDQTGIEQRR
jgi:hypothetical protein